MKPQTKSKYKTITSEERAKIISYFVEDGQTSSQVPTSTTQIATLTGHNLSTIKAIYRIFKKEGRMFKKEKRDRTYNILRNYIVCVVDNEPKCFKVLAKQQEKQEIVLRDNEELQSQIDKVLAFSLEDSKQKVLNLLQNPIAQYEYLRELQILTTNGISETDFTTVNPPLMQAQNKMSTEIKRLLQVKKEDEPLLVKQEGIEDKLTSLRNIFEQQLEMIYGKRVTP